MTERAPIPRDASNDYTPEMAERRASFLRERTGVGLAHVRKASFDPAVLPGSIENFTGVAQVPIGLAGPLRINDLTDLPPDPDPVPRRVATAAGCGQEALDDAADGTFGGTDRDQAA